MKQPATFAKPPARPRTEKQKEASRRNGSQSRGPKTEVGKEISSANSTDHGLYSKKIFRIRIERSEEFEHTLQSFRDEWRPTGPTEASLVRTLALESICLDRFRMLQTEALNAMSDRALLDAFTDDETGGPVTRDQLSPAEIQYAGLETYTLDGHLPNLALIDRMIARADRTFRNSLAALLNLRKARPQPTPPRESSESLERRIAEFRARDEAQKAASTKNEGTNLGPTQPLSNQSTPASAQPEIRSVPPLGSRPVAALEAPPRA